MTKKQRALEVIQRLKEEYPDAGCTLDYDQAWKLLVSVRFGCSVYRRQSKRGSRRSLRKISRCGLPGGGPAGGDRGDREALRSWKK